MSLAESTRRKMLKQAATLAAAAAGAQTAKPQEARSATTASATMFPGFKAEKIQTSGAAIQTVRGGQGPPLLLLHGHPQSHFEWHKVAPELAKEFTVVAADLRGYGDSSKPADGVNHAGYSKRAMAQDQVEVMRHFGFERFAVVGHDRGGRVAHRMMLDHADRITKGAVIDIVPTYKVYHSVTKEFATAYYHWFFLIQPAPFPETVIGRSLESFVRQGNSTPEAYAEYMRAFRDPGTVHAACEDYRAGASIDLEHDEADMNRKIACQLLVLWAEKGAMHRLFDVLATWRERASDVRGKPLPGGHFLPEELPDQTLAELRTFLRS
ncbi:MAG TPA: alpha/beta hydrolase [Bryobacteraceae bacterium]|nr:alpha/beta hydrolase [Bryobacteraceae bacterium]